MALKVTKVKMPTDKYSIKCPYKMTPKYITVHNTYNKASAMSEVSYMISNNNKVSFHVAVDDTRAVQGIEFGRNAWHAGDGNGKGNRESIAVEICYSSIGGSKFTAAEKNAAYYIACLLKQYGWGIERVKKHQDWSGKYCPHRTLDLGWDRFLNMIKSYLNHSKKQSTSSKSETNKQAVDKIKVDGKFGKDTVKETQKYFGTKQDGVISNQPTVNKKYLPAAISGAWQFKSKNFSAGSSVAKKMQKKFGVKEDGLFGTKSVKGMQKFLGLKQTGYMNEETVKAWQKWLNKQ